MTLLTFILLAVGIEHLTDILTNVDLLEVKRQEFEILFPSLSKLARCRFCQSFWLCGAIVSILPSGILGLTGDFSNYADVALTWLVLHKTVVVLIETTDRFLSRAPKNVVVQMINDQDAGS
jgi:hypothetical protein